MDSRCERCLHYGLCLEESVCDFYYEMESDEEYASGDCAEGTDDYYDFLKSWYEYVEEFSDWSE